MHPLDVADAMAESQHNKIKTVLPDGTHIIIEKHYTGALHINVQWLWVLHIARDFSTQHYTTQHYAHAIPMWDELARLGVGLDDARWLPIEHPELPKESEQQNLPPCEPDIFRQGKPIAFLDGRSHAVETWVQSVAATSGIRVDWHYSGGLAQVLYLGDDADRERVLTAIHALAHTLDGTVKRVLLQDATGLHREGVTSAPEHAKASFYEGGDTSSYV